MGMTKKPNHPVQSEGIAPTDKAPEDAESTIQRWQEESREAFESYNRFIEKYGIWSKKYRSW